MPTQQEVFEKFGGSMSTINKHLKTWRDGSQGKTTSGSDLPDFFQFACEKLYHSFKEEFDSFQVAVISSNKAKVDEAMQIVEKRTTESMSLRHELSKSNGDNQTLKSESAQLNAKIDQLEKDLAQQILSVAESRLIAEQRTETIKHLEQQIAHDRLEAQKLMTAHKEEIHSIKIECAELKAQIVEATDHNQLLAITIKGLEKDHSALKDNNQQLAQSLDDKNIELKTLREFQRKLDDRIFDANNYSKELSGKLEAAMLSITSKDNDLTRTINELSAQRSKYEQCKSNLATRTKELSTLTILFDELKSSSVTHKS
tara:strand:+ start:15745 stop:16686 length:942 start_codon:yes stop_codon:yes gene_type:complete